MRDRAGKACALPKMPFAASAISASSAHRTGDIDGSAEQNEIHATESDEEEDIVFQMRGLRGLDGRAKSVAPPQSSRDRKPNASFVLDGIVSRLCQMTTQD